MRPKTFAFSGVFSGIGQRPQLTNTCSRMAWARCSHSDLVLIAGNARSVFSVLIKSARWSFSGRAKSAAKPLAAQARAVTQATLIKVCMEAIKLRKGRAGGKRNLRGVRKKWVSGSVGQ